MVTPPPSITSTVPIVHSIAKLYKVIYVLAHKAPKRDKFGIFLKIENTCLEALTLSIKASLSAKTDKVALLVQLRVEIETLKHLIRIITELKTLEEKTYLRLQTDLQEISKMATGWLKYSQ